MKSSGATTEPVRELIENRRDTRHAGGEKDRRAIFKADDDLFECLPARRAAVARVRSVLAKHEVRRRTRRLSGEPERHASPAEISHDLREPGSPVLCCAAYSARCVLFLNGFNFPYEPTFLAQ